MQDKTEDIFTHLNRHFKGNFVNVDVYRYKDAISKKISHQNVKENKLDKLVQMYFEDSIVCFVWNSLILRFIVIEIQTLSFKVGLCEDY